MPLRKCGEMKRKVNATRCDPPEIPDANRAALRDETAPEPRLVRPWQGAAPEYSFATFRGGALGLRRSAFYAEGLAPYLPQLV